MNVRAEDLEKARALLPGLFKFNEGERFSQAVLALNEDLLFIYNDHAPDQVMGEDAFYSVRYRFPKEMINTIVDEKLIKQPDLAGLNRLAIFTIEEETYYFYYFSDNRKAVNNFIAGLKHYGYEIVSRKISLI